MSHMNPEKWIEIEKKLSDQSLEQSIEIVADTFGSDLLLASSLGLEDQVLTHAFLQVNPSARIFVLDTGRLHPETYDTMAKTSQLYDFHYEVYYPNHTACEEMVRSKGINLFYESVTNRKECCGIRKVEPLKRALNSGDAWMTGLRRAQAVTRTDLKKVEWDNAHQMVKLNLLIDWSEEDIWSYIRAHQVPFNPLHEKGFPSIGCAPCTRAITQGEDIRAGRWWWETPEQKECGLHVVDGKLVRKRLDDAVEKGPS